MKHAAHIIAVALATSVLATSAVEADDWWPFTVSSALDGDVAKTVDVDYIPLEKAEKPWRLCVLYPHLQDSYWVSVNYGVIEEAKRLGVKVSAFQAGGYTALPKQISQYDDCIASGADGIILGAVSEAGLAAKINEGMGKGIVNIAAANPILKTKIDASITADFKAKGFVTGEYVKKVMVRSAAAVAFPGPQGSGWAETYLEGFRESLKTGNVKILAEQFGEASVPAQLRLVEDALQTYPEMNVIWGGAPTAEAAVGAVADAGRDDFTIVASYENQTMLKAISEGKVSAVATEYPVMIGRISVDLAVRSLERKPHEKTLLVKPGLVTRDNISTFDTTRVFAPKGTQPEFTVK